MVDRQTIAELALVAGTDTQEVVADQGAIGGEIVGNRRERVRKGRRVSDFQTIEVDGKLAISVEDLIAAGVIFRE